MGEQNYHLDKSHSTLLPLAIDALLTFCGIDRSDLKCIAIADGPGSYTGLRIGTSIAKGLCYALDIPLVSINTLLGMANEANKYNTQEALLAPMLDARRMEVYCMVCDHQLNVLLDTTPLVLAEDSFVEFRDQPLLFFGNGSQKANGLLKGIDGSWLEHIYTYARSVGELAVRKFKEEQIEDLTYYEPNYLKEFKAIKAKPLI